MADDGLMLNFATGEAATPSTSTPKFKGGSWRERSRLTKNAKYARDERLGNGGRSQAFERATKNRLKSDDAHRPKSDDTQPAGQPPAKRHKRFHDEDPEAREQRRREARPAHLKDASFGGQPGNREVISSLFSHNPEAATAEAEKPEPQEPVKPSNAPLPDGIDTFTSLGLSTSIAAYLLTKMNLKNPTAIQKSAVSQLAKEDADVFIQSETGSGKTLAYLLPIVQRLATIAERQKHETQAEQGMGRESGLFAIILTPTRELCKQISVVLEKLLGCAHYIVAGTVIGGEKKKSEKARLRKGLNILVATPGRLVDHLENTEVLDVSKVRYLVLDEGDRLMDLGFEEDITKIVNALDGRRRPQPEIPGLPEKRITVLCSATMKNNVEKLGNVALNDAVLVKGEKEDGGVDDNEGAFLAPAQLKQSYIICAAKLRLVTLTALLKRTFARKGSVMKAIVFISCADSVDFHHKILTRPLDDSQAADLSDSDTASKPPTDPTLADALSSSPLLSSPNNPLDVYKIHGSLPQQTRTAIIKSFAKSSTASLLIATDVASRGLDLPNLDLVIEYDPAFSKEDHLHRIGRTARLGRDGRAVIFLQPGSEEGYIQVLKDSYKQNAEATANNVTATSANDVLKKGFTSTTGLVGTKEQKTDHETLATEFQLNVERYVLSDTKIKEMAKNAFQSHIRAYATHIASERKWFDIKELHLGHLAKSFGLRDPPGKVNVAGLRSKVSKNEHRPKANEGRKRAVPEPVETGNPNKEPVISRQAKTAADIDETGDAEAAAQKMRTLIRNRNKMMGAGADEFNLG
ncbi:ATP-dependent RNA helicase dbp7 [Knufia fluminis]|uniref:ATP-dependent RNA helicase n=1 Tax=Knufia fluminis TaxID=191047 RepID=A0AAN8F4L9_9EURO|nr:ATP-dependent RNA helicase dbp7 [Knufia fluminis]